MKYPIHCVADLGLLIRAVRKNSGVRQDDLASTAKVSKQFTVDVERGKPTVQFDRVLLLLKELGISLNADISDEVLDKLTQLQGQRQAKAARSSAVPLAQQTLAKP